MRGIQGLVLTAALMCGCSGGSHGEPLPSPTPAAIQSYDANQPVGLVAAAGKVWTVEAGGDEITGRSAPGEKPVHIAIGATPLRAAYDGHLLWVSVFGAGRVVAVDPTEGRVVHSFRVGGQPEGIVAAFGAIWVVRQQARLLTRVSTTGIGPSYHLGNEPRLVAANNSALFVGNFGDDRITRIDPSTGEVKTSGGRCRGPQAMAPRAEVVWVACTPGNIVTAVDATSLKPLGNVRVDGEPDAIQFIGKKLYVVTTGGPTLVEISPNPMHPRVESRTPLADSVPLFDQANVDATLVDGQWWVSSPSENKVYVYTP